MNPKRVALITGAARGIGRAIACDLGADHALAITYRHTDPAPLLRDFPDALAIRADLSQGDIAIDVIARVIGRFGRLDVIVNNAGMAPATPAGDTDTTTHRAILELNLIAPITLVAAAMPWLERGASIVNISSVNARMPPETHSVYAASKAALETWTRAVAKTFGPRGIRVNAVAPGAIETKENPRPADLVQRFVENTALGRIGTPGDIAGDIAGAVRFLISDSASFVTGEVLTVAGGYRL